MKRRLTSLASAREKDRDTVGRAVPHRGGLRRGRRHDRALRAVVVPVARRRRLERGILQRVSPPARPRRTLEWLQRAEFVEWLQSAEFEKARTRAQRGNANARNKRPTGRGAYSLSLSREHWALSRCSREVQMESAPRNRGRHHKLFLFERRGIDSLARPHLGTCRNCFLHYDQFCRHTFQVLHNVIPSL